MSKALTDLAPPTFTLPARLIGRPHISRVIRELEAVDSYMITQAIRSPDVPPVAPGISRVLREVVEVNQLSLLEQKERQRLIRQLTAAKDAGPQVHITFAIEPDILILTKIVTWLRANVHDQALVSVGVQPNIIGGCVVRTPDHVYDLSFQKHFSGKEVQLRKALVEVASA